MNNRHERRATKEQARTTDSGLPLAARDGIALLVRSVDFKLDEQARGVGTCLFRSIAAVEVLQRYNFEAGLEIGSLIYRVGPDPRRDVIAFCGEANAGVYLEGGGGLFHAWVTLGDDILDFSVGDWQADK